MRLLAETSLLLPAAFVVDCLLGDPRFLPHPVRAIGAFAARVEALMRKSFPALVAGLLAWLAVVGGSVLASLSLVWLAGVAGSWLAPFLGADGDSGASVGRWAISVYLVYASIAPRDLAAHAFAVLRALRIEGLASGRKAVSRIVGRDVDRLDEEAVLRATVESVAESSVDGVCAPLFWALLLGPAGAIGYRAANTLDSLWGHKDERWLLFGRVAARADDVLNWLPARLAFFSTLLAAVPLSAFSKGRLHPVSGTRLGWRDRRKHESPNAGWPEAAFAGLLGIVLGGPAWYAGVLVDKPALGEARRRIDRSDLGWSVLLMYGSSLCFIGLLLLAAFLAASLS